jgi:tRNA (guanine26-N2/guanine27-N2)-dimethyltransferase
MEWNFEEYRDRLIIKEEGDIKFYTFRPEEFSNGGTALKKNMPVFYNPVQEINRSISMVAYSAFLALNQTNDRLQPFSICDSMAASGIRSLRLLKYLTEDVHILANDLNPLALRLIEKNAELNTLPLDRLEFANEEAAFLFAKLRKDRHFQTIIDIDPFGTPNIFIDTALRAVQIQGLLGVTATDTAVFFGVKPSACLRKYNIRSLRSSFLKEVGLRILLAFVAFRAHPFMNYVVPMLSLSFNHYIRFFVKILKGKEGVTKNLAQIGYMFWCPKCDWRSSGGLDIRTASFSCPLCQAKVEYGGPMWLGQLHDSSFVHQCQQTLTTTEKHTIPSKKRLEKVLAVIEHEDRFPPGYFDLHKLCDSLQISVAKSTTIIQAIEAQGYHAGFTHIEPRAIKTDIPLPQLKSILKELALASKT